MVFTHHVEKEMLMKKRSNEKTLVKNSLETVHKNVRTKSQ